MHRFFVAPEQIEGERVVLRGEQAQQMVQVLRMQVGDEVVVLDGLGWAYGVRLTAVARSEVTAVVLTKEVAGGEPPIELTLYMALLKRDKFEWVLQKGTEVGVTRFVPLVTQRSLVQDMAMKANKRDRWQKIITEAAEQARRGRVPTLDEPMTLAAALAGCVTECALIPWEEETAVSLRNALQHIKPNSVALFIGPEGGWAAAEIEQAQGAGVQSVTLGQRILRTETAAIVAAALTLFALEGN
jgi:16S rRNA (uracil1498-N3)-methyltransferase